MTVGLNGYSTMAQDVSEKVKSLFLCGLVKDLQPVQGVPLTLPGRTLKGSSR